jgi:hypothetical protein
VKPALDCRRAPRRRFERSGRETVPSRVRCNLPRQFASNTPLSPLSTTRFVQVHPGLSEMWISKTGATAKRGSAAVPSRASADTVKARITDKELDDIVAVLSQVSLAVFSCKVAGEGARFRRVLRETQERPRLVCGRVRESSSWPPMSRSIGACSQGLVRRRLRGRREVHRRTAPAPSAAIRIGLGCFEWPSSGGGRGRDWGGWVGVGGGGLTKRGYRGPQLHETPHCTTAHRGPHSLNLPSFT